MEIKKYVKQLVLIFLGMEVGYILLVLLASYIKPDLLDWPFIGYAFFSPILIAILILPVLILFNLTTSKIKYLQKLQYNSKFIFASSVVGIFVVMSLEKINFSVDFILPTVAAVIAVVALMILEYVVALLLVGTLFNRFLNKKK